MPTVAELKSRREALSPPPPERRRARGYDGKTVECRSLAEIDRAIGALDRKIAAAEGRPILRRLRAATSKPKPTLHGDPDDRLRPPTAGALRRGNLELHRHADHR